MDCFFVAFNELRVPSCCDTNSRTGSQAKVRTDGPEKTAWSAPLMSAQRSNVIRASRKIDSHCRVVRTN